MFSICSRVILHEAEATGCFLDLVQPHDDPLDITTFGEELLDLLFGGVEGQVAHVQRGGDLQELLLFRRAFQDGGHADRTGVPEAAHDLPEQKEGPAGRGRQGEVTALL